jgi:hypothetical protein
VKWHRKWQPTKERGASKEKRIKRHKKSKTGNVEDDGVDSSSYDGG